MFEKWHEFWLWKRFGLHRCDICYKLCLIQYEIGLGYWCCSNIDCMDEASECAEKDYHVWNNEKRELKPE